MPQPKLSSKDKIRCCKHCNQKFVGAVPFVNHQIHCNYDAGPIYRPLDYNEPIPKREDYVKRSNLNKYTHRRRLPPKISRRDNYHDYTEFRKRLVKLHNMNFGDHEVEFIVRKRYRKDKAQFANWRIHFKTKETSYSTKLVYSSIIYFLFLMIHKNIILLFFLFRFLGL